jgi:hypothetical protein
VVTSVLATCKDESIKGQWSQKSFVKPVFAINGCSRFIVSHLLFIFGNDKEIHDHPIKVADRSTKRQGHADKKQRLLPHRWARVAFTTHGGLDVVSKMNERKSKTNLVIMRKARALPSIFIFPRAYAIEFA